MENQSIKRTNSGMVSGILFITFGVLLLIHTLEADDFIPDWLVSWPMILIVGGLISGVKHNFRRAGAYLCVATGLAFLAGQINPALFSGQLILPAVLVGAGLYLMFGKKKKCFLESQSKA